MATPQPTLKAVLNKLNSIDKKIDKKVGNLEKRVGNIEKSLTTIQKDIKIIKNCVDVENAEDFPYKPKANGSSKAVHPIAARSK